MIGLLRRQALEHQPAAAVFRFAGGIGIEGIAAAFNSQCQFERISHDGCLQPLLCVQTRRLLLLPEAELAKTEYRITAVAFLKVILFGSPLDQVFDLPRRKFNRASTGIADEV